MPRVKAILCHRSLNSRSYIHRTWPKCIKSIQITTMYKMAVGRASKCYLNPQFRLRTGNNQPLTALISPPRRNLYLYSLTYDLALDWRNPIISKCVASHLLPAFSMNFTEQRAVSAIIIILIFRCAWSDRTSSTVTRRIHGYGFKLTRLCILCSTNTA